MIFLLAVALLLLPNKSPCNKCKIGKDALTGRSIYLTYDVEPECEGGKSTMLRRINKTVQVPDSLILTSNFDMRYTVTFIVEPDGQISGGRVVHGNINQIGQQILQAVKSCRWIPGKCNGKKVPVLYRYSTIIEIHSE
jgi:hypothetical protein